MTPTPAPAPAPDFAALTPADWRAEHARIAAELPERLLDVQLAAPFFASAGWALRLVLAPGHGSYAVDTRGRLWIDPRAWDADGPPERTATLLHEVAHFVLNHPGRRAAMRETGIIPAHRAADPWLGVALDAVVNALIKGIIGDPPARPKLAAWWRAGGGPVWPAAAWTEEEAAAVGGDFDAPTLDLLVAAWLRRPAPPPPPSGQGKGDGNGGQPGPGTPPPGTGKPGKGKSPGKGTGKSPGKSPGKPGPGTGQPGPGGEPGPGTPAPRPRSALPGDGTGDQWAAAAKAAGHAVDAGHGAEHADALRDAVAAAIRDLPDSPGGRGTGAGSLLLQWARDRLARPSIPWRSILRRALADGIRQQARGPGRFDPHRVRAIRGILRPVEIRVKPRIACILDVSGSMGGSPLKRACQELDAAICQAGATIDAWAHDDGVLQARRDVRSLAAALAGARCCGGTDMRVPLADADRTPGRYACVLILTDCATPWPDSALRTPLIVGACGHGADGARSAGESVPTHLRARVIPCDCSEVEK